jgi:hypothetical protein
MRAAMASNLAANALVRRPKVVPTPDNKVLQRLNSLGENYSSQRALEAIEVPSTSSQ